MVHRRHCTVDVVGCAWPSRVAPLCAASHTGERTRHWKEGEKNFSFSLFITSRTDLELLRTLSASAPSYQTVRKAVVLLGGDGERKPRVTTHHHSTLRPTEVIQPVAERGRGPRGIAISTDTRGVDMKHSFEVSALLLRLLSQ